MEGLSPLLLAIQNNYPPKLISDFIIAGADVNYAIPTTGETALHIALKNRLNYHLRFYIPILIKAGINVNTKNTDGESPLYLAAEIQSYDNVIIKALLEAGADINAINKKRLTALYNASTKGILKCAFINRSGCRC